MKRNKYNHPIIQPDPDLDTPTIGTVMTIIGIVLFVTSFLYMIGSAI